MFGAKCSLVDEQGAHEERLGLGEDRSDELREEELREEEERLGVDLVGELREGLGVE